MSRSVDLREHPDIAWAHRTGYPSWGQPTYYVCEECGEEIEFDEIYEDENHERLCEYCLLKLHRKVTHYNYSS